VSKLYYTPALIELERLDQVRVTALFDPNPANMAELHRAFAASVQLQDFDDLAGLNLDLAIIASPPQFHARQSIRLLQSGVPVLCEKPMALTVAEGEAMAEAASATRQLLAIGLYRRFLPATRMIRDILSQNILGKVVSFSCSEGRLFRWPVQSASYFKQNGVLLDIGAHALDLLTWWWGQPEEITYEDDAMGGVEANCRVRLRFPQGFEGEVRLSRENLLPNIYSIQFDKGWIHWDIDETSKIQMGFLASRYSLEAGLYETSCDGNSFGIPVPAAQDFQQCFTSLLRNVISTVHGTEALCVPAEEGLPSLRAIEYCYSHRSLMEMPWLSSAEAARAKELGSSNHLVA
jgi:predicted dehydrogenase